MGQEKARWIPNQSKEESVKEQHMEREPIALVDMDGTLADYAAAMQRDLMKLAAPGEEVPEDFAANVPPHIKERQRLITRQPEWWLNLPQMPIGFQVLDILRDLDYTIHILTKGPHSKPIAWSQKAQWCLSNVPDAAITITEDKGIVYGRVLVDDYPDYVTRWLQWRPRGFVVMPAHHYNADFEHTKVFRYSGNVFRYSGSEEETVILREKLAEIRNR